MLEYAEHPRVLLQLPEVSYESSQYNDSVLDVQLGFDVLVA
jgi:hypothetical protein